MEHTDLVDPTESRYASVAQEMALSGDWLTPKLPSPDGTAPYFSKPPLHYWLTATAYNLFGVDEWTARLPSLLGAVLILCVVVAFGAKYFTFSIGISAGLITMSSGVFFFLSGASVTDVTLTACCSVATFYCYQFISAPSAHRYVFFLASAWTGFAFLCKGPIGFVLIALPVLLWSCALRDFSWARRVPWVKSIVLFLLITMPWFVMCEMHNPGFMRYFFWNENFARYLFREYGDRYGSGHRHIYGMSWLMLCAAFFPWSFVLARMLFRSNFRQSYVEFKSSRPLVFALCWGVSAALFLTFARQLHIMYLLPGIAGLSIVTAVKLHGGVPSALQDFHKLRSGLFVSKIMLCSAVMICAYLISIVLLTPHIDHRRSAELMLKEIASISKNSDVITKVGIFSSNQYSINWTARAWENELGQKMDLEYIHPDEIFSKEFDYLLLKADTSLNVLPEEMKKFVLAKKMEKWELYRYADKISS